MISPRMKNNLALTEKQKKTEGKKWLPARSTLA